MVILVLFRRSNLADGAHQGCPASRYAASSLPYHGLPEIPYPLRSPPLVANIEAAAFSPAWGAPNALGSGEPVEGGDASIEAIRSAIDRMSEPDGSFRVVNNPKGAGNRRTPIVRRIVEGFYAAVGMKGWLC